MKRIPFVFLILLFLASCGSSNQVSYADASSSKEDATAVLWQQTSAEYKALCYQAYNIASKRLKDMYHTDSGIEGKIIIMDLDETVLDNSPYNAWLIANNQSYSDDSWNKWVRKEMAELVPGAKEFLNLTQDLGISVFFISNRSADHMEYTMNNLTKKGISVTEDKLLLKTSTSQKTERRNMAFDYGEVLMLIGDNLADFSETFDNPELSLEQRDHLVEKNAKEFAKKFIILPNAMYGNWMKALKLNSGSDVQKGLKSFN